MRSPSQVWWLRYVRPEAPVTNAGSSQGAAGLEHRQANGGEEGEHVPGGAGDEAAGAAGAVERSGLSGAEHEATDGHDRQQEHQLGDDPGMAEHAPARAEPEDDARDEGDERQWDAEGEAEHPEDLVRSMGIGRG